MPNKSKIKSVWERILCKTVGYLPKCASTFTTNIAYLRDNKSKDKLPDNQEFYKKNVQ